jgi:hypothetical protein
MLFNLLATVRVGENWSYQIYELCDVKTFFFLAINENSVSNHCNKMSITFACHVLWHMHGKVSHMM